MKPPKTDEQKCLMSYGRNFQWKPSVGTSISVLLREVSVLWDVRLKRFYCSKEESEEKLQLQTNLYAINE